MSATQQLWIGGWANVLAGFVSGAIVGLRFDRETFLGGYASWRRRLVRLGHVALVMLGVLQMLAALAPIAIDESALATTCWIAWRIGAIAMPLVCFLSAWKRGFRHLFAIPVVSLLAAASLTLHFVWKGIGR